jgi:hypothetical protein
MSPSSGPTRRWQPRSLGGPPFTLPPALDRLAEWWAAAPPRLRTLCAVGLVVAVVAAGIAQAAASPYGPPVTVHVATRHLEVGATLTDDDVRRVSWPSTLVPDGAEVVPEGVLRAPLPRGAVLTDAHLGSGGPAADVPVGRVAIPIATETLPAVEPGTALDLVGVRSDGAVVLLTAAALVVHDDGARLWLSVDEADALDVSAAVAADAITAVVRPP